eukprot:763456-Hanusia_phi.AAC.6
MKDSRRVVSNTLQGRMVRRLLSGVHLPVFDSLSRDEVRFSPFHENAQRVCQGAGDQDETDLASRLGLPSEDTVQLEFLILGEGVQACSHLPLTASRLRCCKTSAAAKTV